MKKYMLCILALPFTLAGQPESLSILLDKYLDDDEERPVHSILFYVEDVDNNFVFNQGHGITAKGGERVTEYDQFRIASITKTFLATVILQLIAEEKIQPESRAQSFLGEMPFLDFEQIHIFNNRSYSQEITVEQLLSHRTGLADIYTDRENEFFASVIENKTKQYTPERILEVYYQYHLNSASHFKPGNGWYYSDMNYVLLGLIIENIEGKSLAESIRERILDALKMDNTYFEFYEQPQGNSKRVHQFVEQLDMTEINTSFDWGGGGLVSTNADLATFIKALFNNELINEQSVSQMSAVQDTKRGENRYGLGLYESIYNGRTYYGHYGYYGSYLGFCPQEKVAISYNISQANAGFNVHQLVEAVLEWTYQE